MRKFLRRIRDNSVNYNKLKKWYRALDLSTSLVSVAASLMLLVPYMAWGRLKLGIPLEGGVPLEGIYLEFFLWIAMVLIGIVIGMSLVWVAVSGMIGLLFFAVKAISLKEALLYAVHIEYPLGWYESAT